MNNTITNEQAEKALLTFFWVEAEDEKYNEFRSYYNGIVEMVAHKYFGWVDKITELGYEQVVEAYKELLLLEFEDDFGSDIEQVVRNFVQWQQLKKQK